MYLMARPLGTPLRPAPSNLHKSVNLNIDYLK